MGRETSSWQQVKRSKQNKSLLGQMSKMCGQLPVKGTAAGKHVIPFSTLAGSLTQKCTRWWPGQEVWTMLVGWKSEGSS